VAGPVTLSIDRIRLIIFLGKAALAKGPSSRLSSVSRDYVFSIEVDRITVTTPCKCKYVFEKAIKVTTAPNPLSKLPFI
jgi:hypothetical protein